MNPAGRSGMTAADFLGWTASLPEGRRYELVGGESVAMSPERIRHSLVKLDCAVSLRQAVRACGVACTVFGDGATVVVDNATVYEPDVTVQCGEPIDLDAVTVPHPTIVVEVLSPSTRGVDTGRKLVACFQLASDAHYLVLGPESRVVTHHHRSGERIITRILREGRLVPSPPEIEVEVADLFTSV